VAALTGCHIIVLEDHDEDGRRIAADAHRKLAAVSASIRVVPTEHLWKYLPAGARDIRIGDDVEDWLKLGGDPAKLPDICRGIRTEGAEPFFWHGEPDPRGRRKWRIRNLMPAIGAGLLAGQWGTGKTFMAIELATTTVEAGQFCGRQVVEPCGVLILATEGAFEIRDRIEAAVHEKCPGEKMPIVWRETCPTLLAPGAVTALSRKIEEASEECMARFDMPVGLVIIDILANAAGYAKAGDENDPAVCQKLMNVLHQTGEAAQVFVLALDHFGKTVESGTRGGSSKEGSADIVLACLGQRDVSGAIVDTRLALRKVRGGPSGQEFPFTLRTVSIPNPGEDSESSLTCVISWEAAAAPMVAKDPWEEGHKASTALAMKALRRALMKLLPVHGVQKKITPDSEPTLMVTEDLVRDEFVATTVADGNPKQKLDAKRMRFKRAVERAENQGLIGRADIEEVTYLWLTERSDV